MTERKRTSKTFDEICLDVLAYEFEPEARSETERKIKRRLRYHRLGPYQQERVDLLRRLKNDVQEEIYRHEKSHYFTGLHDEFASMQDFDTERMVQDLVKSYPEVTEREVRSFVTMAVYLYYLR